MYVVKELFTRINSTGFSPSVVGIKFVRFCN